mmetsp:Transcript_12217/g.18484  ORF Transcript_12217/g.18484 Transcript_12217/m.18484 type:complete len:584 (-) Transcript_12217:287-2038(-)|eukprot:CAMPEP_0185023294 /NCGR_PEP_ID=MMETSP1103-20130426/5977_1 /TAXON_ID=36769 /ORGANISM="Paraphysomonas bandaiensis, Strain Caron Lab Isolate" /LENGTH=583 /DNA_ID=CAMNT_0027555825 /DNA_START=198 /DNA_END=1952 /DNA_ORIENTATION=-
MFSVLYDIQQSKTGRLIISAANTVDDILHRSTAAAEDINYHKTKLSLFSYISIQSIRRLPIIILYYLYVWLPLFFCTLTLKYLIIIVKVSARRSPRINRLVVHIVAFHDSVLGLYHHIRKSTFIDIINWILQTLLEVLVAAIYGSSVDSEEELGDEMAELLEYREYEDRNPIPAMYRKRMRRMMHYDVPTHPFHALVRVKSSPQRSRTNTEWSEAESVTPGSFPPSPESRAACMSRSTERANNLVFIARDKLRLQAREVAERDEHQRRLASKLLVKGKFGTFDPYHTSQCIRLSNGNHSAYRHLTVSPAQGVRSSPVTDPLGNLQPCSTRATLPVMRNAFVYLEFFIRSLRAPSAQNGTEDSCHPGVAVGLASCDFPIDSMVGKSERSIGLSCDGVVSVCGEMDDDIDYERSASYQVQTTVSSGDRIGVLVYIASSAAAAGASLSRPTSTSPENTSNIRAATADSRPMSFSKTDSWSSFSVDPSENMISGEDLVEEPGDCMDIRFSLNGYPLSLPWSAHSEIGEIMTGTSNLYPVVSFLSTGTRVWGGFSADDVLYTSRESIGAPPGENIYCLDGSILIQKDE